MIPLRRGKNRSFGLFYRSQPDKATLIIIFYQDFFFNWALIFMSIQSAAILSCFHCFSWTVIVTSRALSFYLLTFALFFVALAIPFVLMILLFFFHQEYISFHKFKGFDWSCWKVIINLLVKLLLKSFFLDKAFHLSSFWVDCMEQWTWQIFEWALYNFCVFSLSFIDVEFFLILKCDLPFDLVLKVTQGLLMNSVLWGLTLDSLPPFLIKPAWHFFLFRWFYNFKLSISERRIAKCWMDPNLNAFVQLMLVLLKLDS